MDTRGRMKPHQLFAYNMSLKRPLLVADVSSVLRDVGAVCEISLTSSLGQQARRLAFHLKTLTNFPNILRRQLNVKLSINIIIRLDSICY